MQLPFDESIKFSFRIKSSVRPQTKTISGNCPALERFITYIMHVTGQLRLGDLWYKPTGDIVWASDLSSETSVIRGIGRNIYDRPRTHSKRLNIALAVSPWHGSSLE